MFGPMKRYLIATLGCRTNQYESQLFASELRQLGFVPAKDGEEVDLCIINTCTVTDQADATSRRQVRSLAQKYPKARLVVTGCMATSRPEELLRIDPRIEIVSNKDKDQVVRNFSSPQTCTLNSWIDSFDGHTRAFVKVQDGCNSFCSYCIIPYVRGRSRSRPMDEIATEVKALAGKGYKEIVITGINVGDYHLDRATLADVVRMIDQIDGIERIRISSIDPTDVDEPLIEAMVHGRHTCPNLHLVLQSGSNTILKQMNRKYTRELFLDTVDRLKQKNSDFTFTTDVIVGFPGENDRDFQDTLDILRQVQFAKVHIFPYSPRERTRAVFFPSSVASSIVSQRKEEMQKVANQMAYELREKFMHRTMDVLLEEGNEEFLPGHTANFLAVQVPRKNYKRNEMVKVQFIENRMDGLIGQVI